MDSFGREAVHQALKIEQVAHFVVGVNGRACAGQPLDVAEKGQFAAAAAGVMEREWPLRRAQFAGHREQRRHADAARHERDFAGARAERKIVRRRRDRQAIAGLETVHEAGAAAALAFLQHGDAVGGGMFGGRAR